MISCICIGWLPHRGREERDAACSLVSPAKFMHIGSQLCQTADHSLARGFLMYSHALRNIAMQHLVRADHRHHQSDSSSYLFLLFYLVLIIILSYASPHSACTQLERDSLLSFLSNLSSSSNNSLLGSWRGTDCCIWEGISCDGNKSVTRLWLPFRGLRGQISPALANLTYLSHLNLSHNRLTGTLPPALLWSDHLVILDVSFNALSGSLSVLPSSSSSPPGNHPLQVMNVSSNFIE